MSTADPNRVVLTGENPFIRLSATDGAENSTDASFWRRSAADPHRARGAARPGLGRLHRADPGNGGAAGDKRRPGGRPALAARARGPSLRDLRAGLLRELDRGTLKGFIFALSRMWGSIREAKRRTSSQGTIKRRAGLVDRIQHMACRRRGLEGFEVARRTSP